MTRIFLSIVHMDLDLISSDDHLSRNIKLHSTEKILNWWEKCVNHGGDYIENYQNNAGTMCTRHLKKNVNTVIGGRRNGIHLQLSWLDIAVNYILTVSFLALLECGTLLRPHAFQTSLILKKIKCNIRCSPDYSFISNVSVSHFSILNNPLS